MSIGSRLLLVGLKGSGKTSYLAALWHLIESGEIPTTLAVTELQPDREYLNRIRDSWLRFEEVGRTSLRSQEMVSLLMRDRVSGSAIDLRVPDLSGELFRLQWATRKATEFYADLAVDTSGVLLFIHPGTMRRSRRILPGACSLEENLPSDNIETAPVLAWTSESSPTDVQLVELLQFVEFLHAPFKSLRVAVIVSAWDLVRGLLPPEAWLESELPLLAQFLGANADLVPYRVYGVSAQGGDLQRDLDRLQAETRPSRRIRASEGKSEPNSDLTVPIRFLLGI